MGITYSKPKYDLINPQTYLKTIFVMDDMEGFNKELRYLVKVSKNGETELSLLKYDNSTSIVYSEDFMVFYSLFQDFLDIRAVIDLNELRELNLTKEEEIKYFKTIYDKDDLDIEILKKPNCKKKVYYRAYDMMDVK